MIINEAFMCQATRTKCYMDDSGNIRAYPYSRDNMMTSYNPFKESKSLYVPLYAVFTDLKEDSDILKFIESYGFLGLHFEPFTNKNWLEFAASTVKHESFYEGYSENIDEVKKEISLMSAILELVSEFKNNTEAQKEILNKSTLKDRFQRVDEIEEKADSEALKDKIDNVYKYNGRSIKIDNLVGHHPRLIAQDLIIKELEIKLMHINMRLSYSISQERFVENRIVHNLLTSMYLMLYEDLTTGKRLSKCKNRTCSRWFTIETKHKKQYCSLECEQAEKQRRYRERKQLKEGK